LKKIGKSIRVHLIVSDIEMQTVIPISCMTVRQIASKL